MRRGLLVFCTVLVLIGCGESRDGAAGQSKTAAGHGVDYALAIHGGAGSTPGEASAARQRMALQSLEDALRTGLAQLESGATSLDVVEAVLRRLEDDPSFNAGKGSVFNAVGAHELDASIMDGATLAGGGVAGVTTVKNPISLARLVMERTPHVLLAGPGAESFADRMQVERVAQDYFFTQPRWDALQRARRRAELDGPGGGTVGAVALDLEGNLAAGTSTGGRTNKMVGRVGDSPIIGAGTYADNATCAVSGTGKGEEFIRHSVAYSISALIAETGLSVGEAAERVVLQRLAEGDGGVIALGPDGSIAMVFNTEAMYRGAADSRGRFELAVER